MSNKPQAKGNHRLYYSWKDLDDLIDGFEPTDAHRMAMGGPFKINHTDGFGTCPRTGRGRIAL